MARRGSGTLLAGSRLESPHLLLGRILCLSDRLPWPPPSRVSACSACPLAPPVCRSSARHSRCEPAHAPRSSSHLGGCAGFLAAFTVLGATMSCVCSHLSPRQSSRLLMTSLLRTACPPCFRQARCPRRRWALQGLFGLVVSVYVLRPPSPLLRIGRLGPIACLFWKGKRLRFFLPHLRLPEAQAPSLRAAAEAALVLATPAESPLLGRMCWLALCRPRAPMMLTACFSAVTQPVGGSGMPLRPGRPSLPGPVPPPSPLCAGAVGVAAGALRWPCSDRSPHQP